MGLRDREAAKTERETADDCSSTPRPDRSHERVGEGPPLQQPDRTLPSERVVDGQQEQRQDVDWVEDPCLAISEQRVPRQQVGRPKGQTSGSPRLTQHREDRVIKDPRVVLDNQATALERRRYDAPNDPPDDANRRHVADHPVREHRNQARPDIGPTDAKSDPEAVRACEAMPGASEAVRSTGRFTIAFAVSDGHD